MDESEVYGNIFDHQSNPKENIIVEAYHVAYTLPPIILPLRYYLGKAMTNQNGKFRITFPTEAYGVIDRFRAPNIELRICDSNQTLFKHPIRLFVIQHVNNNFGDITIPANYVYSDEIEHVDLKEMIDTYLPDISDLDKDQVAAIIPEYVESYERSSKYSNEELVTRSPISYRGMIVPKRPKTKKHTPHKIPWYETWKDQYDV
jgi:hypothetical protein